MARGNSESPKEENLQTPKPEGCRSIGEQEEKKPKRKRKKPAKEEEAGISIKSKAKASEGDSDTKPKREKKVYILPGQKHDPPPERDPARIFYSSLYDQRPSSQMAQNWMMEHGLLSPEKARRVYNKKKMQQAQTKASTESTQKKYLSGNDKKVQPKDATKSRQKKNDKKPQPRVSTESSKKNVVSSEDESDDVIQPKKKRCLLAHSKKYVDCGAYNWPQRTFTHQLIKQNEILAVYEYSPNGPIQFGASTSIYPSCPSSFSGDKLPTHLLSALPQYPTVNGMPWFTNAFLKIRPLLHYPSLTVGILSLLVTLSPTS